MAILGDAVILGSGGSGETASIFVTGVQQSDTVTCTKGGRSFQEVWGQKVNPAAHGLPSGYTELSYIESTGTQYINTGIYPNQNTGFGIDMYSDMPISSEASQSGAFFGSRKIVGSGQIDFWLSSYGTAQVCIGANVRTVNNYTPSIRQSCRYDPYTFTSFTGTDTTLSISSYNLDKPILLFCTMANNTSTTVTPSEYARMKLYSFYLTQNGTKVRDFIPCKNSSNVVGLYDLVSNTFFTNSGTGTFTAGDEIPQYIYGYRFSGLDEYGTYTLSVNGYNSENVLIDAATEFSVEITREVYLYNLGDMCNAVTGGWRSYPSGIVSGHTVDAVTFNSADITAAAGYTASSATDTNNQVDVTHYSSLKIDAEVTTTNQYVRIGLRANNSGYYDWDFVRSIRDGSVSSRAIYTIDVSDLTGSYYAFAGAHNETTLIIHKMWLE